MGNFSWLSALVGFMVAILFEEVFIRSGKHPVSIQIDPTVLKALPNEPELELLLEVEYFRNQSLVQQNALRESKRDHDRLTLKLEDLERDFHMTVNPQVFSEEQNGEGLTKKSLTAECALNVRLAREKACTCEVEACPVFYTGYDCKTGIERVPDCLAPWKIPFNETSNFPFTLSQNSLEDKYGKHVTPVLEFGYYPAKKDCSSFKECEDEKKLSLKMEMMKLPLTDSIMKLLPSKEIIGSNLYRSCALVGSSSQLMQQNLSKIIDNHDVIIRLNGAVVNGYEDHVGSRTHLRFVTSQWIGFREFATEKIIHLDHESADPLYGCDMNTECTHAAATMEKYVEFLKLKKKVHTYTIHPQVAQWLRTKQNRTYAGQDYEVMGSTGFQAMLMMLHVCEKVDLFGFTGSTSQKYFDDTSNARKQAELLAQWNQEMFEGNTEKDKYYHGYSLPTARRLLASSVLGKPSSSPNDDSDALAMPEEDGAGTVHRTLQRRHKKKKAPPPPKKKKAPPPPIEVEELEAGIPDSIANGLITGNLIDLDYERQCQQDLVNKGIVTNYGIDIDMSFIASEHQKIQNELATRLDRTEEEIAAQTNADV
ncbi:sialyltransferase [Chloropicon primus]|uniref:beta-galactoside alpha-(2,6)-sialyltransferase n=2 Tax=Chloropicon primus TaxID=1764295 RepID=A0A5B8MSN7_9CHLO|nr:sialyltransferase [Chloropicon primus]UPR02882.1 sialyltransferase [Chloropicon primus]|eukprot:QDZ23669.1 sialyltransferase [Chloropicon primus]